MTRQVISDDPNEFSVFFDELKELKDENNDNNILEYLLKNYRTKKDEDEFWGFFFKNNSIKSKEFTSIGIFEDLSYYPIWLNNQKLVPLISILKETHSIYYWRRIKGDGNCFYRAVLISYLENLIMAALNNNKPSIFFSLVKEFLFTPFPNEKELFHSKTLTVILFIYNAIKKKDQKAYDILYRVINMSDCIEKSLILWLKIKLTTFLKENLELEIEGIKLIQCIPGLELNEDLTYERDHVFKYIDSSLIKMNEYAEGYPLYITPFVLKNDIDIYYINSNDGKLAKETMYYHKDLLFVPVDSFLEFLPNKENISILFKDPHYDTLASRAYVNSIAEVYTNDDFLLVEGLFNESQYNKYKTEVLEEINKLKKKNSQLTGGVNSLNKMFTKEEECKVCSNTLKVELPCGCQVCNNCSIELMKKDDLVNDIHNEINICKCSFMISKIELKKVFGLNKIGENEG